MLRWNGQQRRLGSGALSERLPVLKSARSRNIQTPPPNEAGCASPSTRERRNQCCYDAPEWPPDANARSLFCRRQGMTDSPSSHLLRSPAGLWKRRLRLQVRCRVAFFVAPPSFGISVVDSERHEPVPDLFRGDARACALQWVGLHSRESCVEVAYRSMQPRLSGGI